MLELRSVQILNLSPEGGLNGTMVPVAYLLRTRTLLWFGFEAPQRTAASTEVTDLRILHTEVADLLLLQKHCTCCFCSGSR